MVTLGQELAQLVNAFFSEVSTVSRQRITWFHHVCYDPAALDADLRALHGSGRATASRGVVLPSPSMENTTRTSGVKRDLTGAPRDEKHGELVKVMPTAATIS